ncbi:MAG: DUF6279 family lipoprotein [Pseudomonadota bacterium]
MSQASSITGMPARPAIGVRSTRVLTLLCVLLAVAGCTNSKLLLRPLYNSLDNRIDNRVREVVTLSSEQTAAMRTASDDFHLWHRTYELPQYAALLADISAQIGKSSATRATVDGWFASATDARERAFVCSPVRASAQLMQSFSDAQVQEIRKQLLNPDPDADDWDDDDDSEPHRRIRRYLSLIGFKMQPDQVERLRLMFEQVRAVRPAAPDFRTVARDWNARFVSLLETRTEPDFENRLQSYLSGRHQAFAGLRRDRVQAMWREYAVSEIQQLTPSQREFAANWLGKLGRTLQAFSRDYLEQATVTRALLPCSPLASA